MRGLQGATEERRCKGWCPRNKARGARARKDLYVLFSGHVQELAPS